MAEFMQKMLAARRVLKREQTKEEVAKELHVQVSTVDTWVRAVKTAAVREHVRMETEEPAKKAKNKKKTKPKVKLPEPEKVQEEAPTKPTVVAPDVKAVEPEKEEEPWDLI